MTTRATNRQPQNSKNGPAVNQALIDLIDSWLAVDEVDAAEQRETMRYLRRALDEDRPAGYKLFA